MNSSQTNFDLINAARAHSNTVKLTKKPLNSQVTLV